MPRTPAKKKSVPVIPSNSLVASAVRYSGKAARIYRPNQDWQIEAYRHYAICGEARFAARFFGQALSRATLHVARKGEDGPEKQTAGSAVDYLNDLFNGKDGQEQMLEALGVHLTVAGECYLVGRTVTAESAREGEKDGDETWEIVSIVEMKVNGTKWAIDYGDGRTAIPLGDEDVVIRIWLPNPARRIEADSPFRSLLPILTEIEWLTRHIFAQAQSRLTGAGILFLPQGMSFPPPPADKDGNQPKVANEADAFMLTLADAMLTPISDPSSPSAVIPVAVTAPDDTIDKARLMHFWSDLDEKALEMRQAAITRFADGMDLPREQILGMSSNSGTGGGNSNGVSHWGAWQIEESTIKFHIEPMLQLICNSLTIGYLRPLMDDATDDFITYDTARLRLRPDRSKEAIELWDRMVISTATMLREVGFNVKDAADDKEVRQRILMKLASGSATPEQVTAALKVLGIDLPIEAPAEPGLPSDLRETRPDPSLEDHPERPRTPAEGEVPPELLAASDALVWRALERAGNRIRQKTGVKPPGVPAYEIHTLYHANGDAEWCLEDAWSCAPQVLDGMCDVDATVQTLNSYCRALLSEQAPHSRTRLAVWLALGGKA